MKHLLLIFSAIILFQPLRAQDKDSLMSTQLFGEALNSNVAYQQLFQLCSIAPGRLAGTPESAIAIDFMFNLMKSMPFDTVYKQPCMVRKWIRGNEEEAWFTTDGDNKTNINIDVLGGSVPTPEKGILAPVIVFSSIEEMQKANPATIKGKIVYFNRPMNQNYYITFRAYGENASMRVYGADEASKFGAIAVVVRSLNTATDTFPHTGIMRYKTSDVRIPGFAVSTADADVLDKAIAENPGLKIYLKCSCIEYAQVQSYNVIGEIKGSVFPARYISVGGHLDSWFNSSGAHDDGGGCIQSLEVARLFFVLGYKPQNTIRVVMFIDEEMEQRGGRAYANNAIANGEKHVFALESDRGVTTPTGFSIDASESVLQKMELWKKYFEAYGIRVFEKGGSGVDVGFLKQAGVPLAGLVTESQRYFEFHHSANDTWQNVNRREMQLGSAAMALLIYLVDQHGLDK
ncbi:MAG: peptidase M28 family protein [Bacteroidetes bacterium HGW-Bacteroidetes-6]|jgi:hypothetical protein|nr:MAG: peptidase M28 family protein [Bacteroidetes bacterium HGW-Bacteroidetes-6]